MNPIFNCLVKQLFHGLIGGHNRVLSRELRSLLSKIRGPFCQNKNPETQQARLVSESLCRATLTARSQVGLIKAAPSDAQPGTTKTDAVGSFVEPERETV